MRPRTLTLFETPLRFAAVLAASTLPLLAGSAQATFVGDLVYCDENANGTWDAGETGIDGVEVDVVCTADDGTVCADYRAVTGTIHPSAEVNLPLWKGICGSVETWDPTDPEADLTGRYLVEVFDVCNGLPRPWNCTVTVDPSTVPASCNDPVTPVAGGLPVDGNADGDLCDAVDGPFPEGQVLGNQSFEGGCNAYPDSPPSTGVYHAVIAPERDGCSLHNDFGFTPGEDEEPPTATRTPGGWKNRPPAVEQFLPVEFCGRTVTEVCDAIELLGEGGGGLSKWARHATAAQLNCNAFGCPDGIASLIADGNAACAASQSFDFDTAGTILDEFNNSGEDVPVDFWQGAADPFFCDATAPSHGKKAGKAQKAGKSRKAKGSKGKSCGDAE